MVDSFSRRHGYRQTREVTVREDAPEPVRAGLIAILLEMGFAYGQMREVICPVLHTFPDANNWSEIPNVRDEVIGLVQYCEWYRVYDIIEAVYAYLRPLEVREKFAARINGLFEEYGIGWQMTHGQIMTRGPQEFEHAVARAVVALGEAGHATPKKELEEARRDLSRRPEPDITGTVQHCIAALECTGRIVANEPRATLGELIQRHSADLGIPRPLDKAVESMWGYASEMGRHLREGRVPDREEAELLLGMAAALINYLLQRSKRGDSPV
jgi:hypothetical protein